MGVRIPFFGGLLPNNPFDNTGVTPNGDFTQQPIGMGLDDFLTLTTHARKLQAVFNLTQDDSGTNPDGSTWSVNGAVTDFTTTMTLPYSDEEELWQGLAEGSILWVGGPVSFSNEGSWTTVNTPPPGSMDPPVTATGSYTCTSLQGFFLVGCGLFPDKPTVLTGGGNFPSLTYWPTLWFTADFIDGDTGSPLSPLDFSNYPWIGNSQDNPVGTITLPNGSSCNIYGQASSDDLNNLNMTLEITILEYWPYATTTGLPVWDTATGAQLNPPDS